MSEAARRLSPDNPYSAPVVGESSSIKSSVLSAVQLGLLRIAALFGLVVVAGAMISVVDLLMTAGISDAPPFGKSQSSLLPETQQSMAIAAIMGLFLSGVGLVLIDVLVDPSPGIKELQEPEK